MKRTLILAFAVLPLLLACACRPPRPSADLAAGVAAARAGEWDAAVRHWRGVAAREPGSAAAHNNLAVACEKKGDWEEARKEYETALGLDPGNAVIMANFERFKARLDAARKTGPAPAGRTP